MEWEDDYWFHEYEKPPIRRRSVRNRASDAAARAKRIKKFKALLEQWEEQYLTSMPQFQQCKHLIGKFGGIVPFSIAVGVHPDIIIYRWLMVPRGPGGRKIKISSSPKTHGFIPYPRLARLLIVARHWGVYLKPEDIYPEFIDHDAPRSILTEKEIVRWVKQLEPNANMRDFEDAIASLASIPE